MSEAAKILEELKDKIVELGNCGSSREADDIVVEIVEFTDKWREALESGINALKYLENMGPRIN